MVVLLFKDAMYSTSAVGVLVLLYSDNYPLSQAEIGDPQSSTLLCNGSSLHMNDAVLKITLNDSVVTTANVAQSVLKPIWPLIAYKLVDCSIREDSRLNFSWQFVFWESNNFRAVAIVLKATSGDIN